MTKSLKKEKNGMLWFKNETAKKVGVVCAVAAGLAILFLMMRGGIPAPKEIVLGPISIRLYSIMVVLGLLASTLLFNKLKRSKKDLEAIDTWDGLLYVIVPGIIGARIYHVLTDFYLYQNNLVGIFQIWNGGLGFIGGIVGGVLGAAWYFRRKKISLIKVLGILTIAVPVGQAVGRLGNFFNRELFGIPSDLPWAVYVDPAQNPIPQLRSYSYFHPLFLYEALANLAMAAVLYRLWKRGVADSTLVITYITGYGIIRYTLDFLRIDGRNGVWYLSYAQWLVLAWLAFVVVFGGFYQVWHRRKYGKWFTEKSN